MTRAAEIDAPRPGEFCERHFSWLCQAGQGECQRPVEDPFRQATAGAHTRVTSPEVTLDDIAAAEQRGREDNADHSMCYVSGSRALEAKLAAAWSEGHASGRNYQGDGWNSDAHDPERDNPYRAALDPQ